LASHTKAENILFSLETQMYLHETVQSSHWESCTGNWASLFVLRCHWVWFRRCQLACYIIWQC